VEARAALEHAEELGRVLEELGKGLKKEHEGIDDQASTDAPEVAK
jgi:hypothetical protein